MVFPTLPVTEIILGFIISIYFCAALIILFSVYLIITQVFSFAYSFSIFSFEPIRMLAPLLTASSKKACPSCCVPESAIKAFPGKTSLLSDTIRVGIEASCPSTTPPAKAAKSDTFQCVIIESLPPLFATMKPSHRDHYMEFYDFRIQFLARVPFPKSQRYRHLLHRSRR